MPGAREEKGALSPEQLTSIELTESSSGTRLRLRVKPGARKNTVLGVRSGALLLSVTAPPDRGKANKAVLRLLAQTLDLPGSTLELVSGQGSRDKTVLVPAPAAVILKRLS